jgi:hypothetical protein
MTRSLHEIDKVYSQLDHRLDVDEKIKYCMSLIQKTKEYVVAKKQNLTETVINRSSEIINSAEMEIMKLYYNKQKTKFKKK